jgi:hypothetical protein
VRKSIKSIALICLGELKFVHGKVVGIEIFLAFLGLVPQALCVYVRRLKVVSGSLGILCICMEDCKRKVHCVVRISKWRVWVQQTMNTKLIFDPQRPHIIPICLYV